MHHGVKQLSTLAVFSSAASIPSEIHKMFVTVSIKEKKTGMVGVELEFFKENPKLTTNRFCKISNQLC